MSFGFRGNTTACYMTLTALLPALLIANSSFAQTADNPDHTLSVAGYFSKGNYGEASNTRIHYYPVSYQQQLGKWGFQVTIPRLEINGLGNVLVNVGGVTRARASNQAISSAGLGDVVASATYQFDPMFENAPFFDLVFEVKIPTADEDKGLGTGEYDQSIKLDFYQAVASSTVFGSIGYRFRGKSELFTGLDDSAFFELGIQQPLNNQITVGLIYDYIEPASIFSKEIHELLPFINWQISPNWSVMTYGAWGFTQDSPDFAVGAQLSYQW